MNNLSKGFSIWLEGEVCMGKGAERWSYTKCQCLPKPRPWFWGCEPASIIQVKVEQDLFLTILNTFIFLVYKNLTNTKRHALNPDWEAIGQNCYHLSPPKSSTKASPKGLEVLCSAVLNPHPPHWWDGPAQGVHICYYSLSWQCYSLTWNGFPSKVYAATYIEESIFKLILKRPAHRNKGFCPVLLMIKKDGLQDER